MIKISKAKYQTNVWYMYSGYMGGIKFPLIIVCTQVEVGQLLGGN